MESFCHLALSADESASESQLLELFLQSVESCVPYLTTYHIQILQLLSQASPQSAITAISYFLSETVRKWRHAPLLSELRILTRRRVPPTPIVQSGDLKYDFLLLPILRRLSDDPALSLRFLKLFTLSLTFPMPSIHNILYFEGIEFSLSVLDLDIMVHLFRLLGSSDASKRQPAPEPQDAQTAMANAFTIRTRSRHYPKAPKGMPVPTERSQDMTPLKLQENKAMHDYLFSISSDLQPLQNILESAKAVLVLANRSLAAHLVKIRESREGTTDFAINQRIAYAVQIFSTFVRSPLLEWVARETQGDVETVHGRLIGRDIQLAHAQGTGLPACIVDATVNYVNKLKDDFNQEYPGNPQIHCNPLKEIDYLQCEAFVNAAGSLGFALAMEKISRTKMRLIGEIENSFVLNGPMLPALRAQALDSLVHMNSRELGFFRVRQPSAAEEGLVALAESAGALKRLLVRLDRVCKVVFENDEERFGMGGRVFLFLEIERLMRNVFEDEAFRTP
jgi:hypothetical protein